MGKTGIVVHRWTEEDEAALSRCVQTLEPLMAHYEGQKGHCIGWWDAVAGRLCGEGGILVTGDACERRWKLIADRKRKAAETERARVRVDEEAAARIAAGTPISDSWDRLADRIDEYEESVVEATLGHAEAIRDDLEKVLRYVEALARAWDVSP